MAIRALGSGESLQLFLIFLLKQSPFHFLCQPGSQHTVRKLKHGFAALNDANEIISIQEELEM